MPVISLNANEKKSFDDVAVKTFQEYLRIPSVHPDVNYDACIKFLEKQAKELNLSFKVYTVVKGKPIAILTWTGTEPKLPSILLNSHMDVVPVYEDQWSHKPFSADIDEKGRIYARGTQDMKSVGVQYLEAIRRLRNKGVSMKRTIHVSFVPDEETGGKDGMKKFAKTNDFRALNVGASLDEGMASPDEEFILYYGERCIWHMHIHCPGQPGHGSLLLDNTAGEKVQYLLNKFYKFREEEKQKLKSNSELTVGDVTTVNLTQLSGGVQSNVVPPEFVIVIDCRIPVTVDIGRWERTIAKWCEEAGAGVRIEFEQKETQVPVTKLDNSNPYWVAFQNAANDLNLKIKKQIFPGGTDSRYVRELGIPAFGFSPINNTPVLLHDTDEYLERDVFLKGVEIYCEIIPALANLQDS